MGNKPQGQPEDSTERRVWADVQKCIELLLPLTPDDRARVLRTVQVYFDQDKGR